MHYGEDLTLDLGERTSGYEPEELSDCSTPVVANRSVDWRHAT